MKQKAGNRSSWPLASLKNTSMNSYRLAFWTVRWWVKTRDCGMSPW